MCGIVAAVVRENIVDVLIEGLKKLEYRGCDSAGLTLSGEQGGEVSVRRRPRRRMGPSFPRQAARDLSGPRPVFPHRAGSCSEAEGSFLYTRRSLRYLRTEARSAGTGRPQHAGNCRSPNDSLLEKLKSKLQEVRSRGGERCVFADAESHIKESGGVHILQLLKHYGVLSPVLHVVPLQLLFYHVALIKGTDVDKRRNLAKSLTVE